MERTDSTIDPLKNQRFSFTNVSDESWLLDTRKGTIEIKVSISFLVCKGLSVDYVGEGVEGRRIGGDTARAGFETGDFVKEKSGGLP